MQSPAIHIEDVRKDYILSKSKKVKQALKGINLQIPQGSFFGLLGPNGAGKSTLINILAGITKKTAGHASIMGHDIDKDVREAKLAIGVVPQELVLDPFFSVREALENHAGYYGVPKSKRRTDEIIQALGLTDKADARPRSLSGGMRRRLLIGKALVHAPKVLILDEPTAGVDVELRQQLWAYVRELNRQGTTIVLTTHYLEEAETLCDQLAIIHHGEVIACDSKARLMKSLDEKELTIRCAEPLSTIPDALVPYAPTLTKDGEIVVAYRIQETTVDGILHAVSEAGLKIADLSTKEADLEAIFRHLTKAA